MSSSYTISAKKRYIACLCANPFARSLRQVKIMKEFV